MVILNTEILMCKNSLTKSIKKIMEEVMDEYFQDEIYFENLYTKKKIMENIIKQKVNNVKSNNFWYLNSSKNVCTYIHKRGKKEGYMCHKKIRTNLNGQKEDFLCSSHSKKHTPNKRKNKFIDFHIDNNFEINNKNKTKYLCISKIKNKVKKTKNRKKRIYLGNCFVLDFQKIIGKLV